MSFIADIFASRTAARGQERAAQVAQQTSDASLAEQRRQYDLSRQDQQPWLQTGQSALSRIAGLYGLSGQAGTTPAANADGSPFFASPDYNFRLSEAMRGLNARNAALGIQDSGAAQRSALTLAGNQASGEYNNYVNRLAGIAGVGQTAAQNNAAAGQGFANAVTNINTNLGQQLGSSYTNRGNIYGNLISNLNGQAQQAATSFLGMRR